MTDEPRQKRKYTRYKRIQEHKGKGLRDKIGPRERELIFLMAQTMLPVDSIATILNTTRVNLHKYYQTELDRGREIRKQKLCEAMWDKALGEEKSTSMQIWLSKQHLGYREPQGETQTDIQFNVTCHEVPRAIEADAKEINLIEEKGESNGQKDGQGDEGDEDGGEGHQEEETGESD